MDLKDDVGCSSGNLGLFQVKRGSESFEGKDYDGTCSGWEHANLHLDSRIIIE